ncbi:ABC transporter ATP-binding protein [Chloroflexales bacterium ZM16-3]|nr:ABC transporter ATP-binding protein [Chloroflexales bacterium ZM16-3]
MLTIEGLQVAYGSQQVLWDIDLRVERGEFVTLVGANGAGKTTLLRTISGLLTPQAGRISFGDEVITGMPAHAICERGLIHVPEGRELFPRMHVYENLELGAFARRARKQRGANLERIYALFPVLRDRARQDAGTLSGGEQQMVAIGRGLMASPSLLMLDEPSLGIAPILVETIMETLRKLNSEGLTILLVSQELHYALELAHRAYVIENGRIVLSGNTADLRDDHHIQQAYLGL